MFLKFGSPCFSALRLKNFKIYDFMRPKKSSVDKRSEEIKVRYTPSEYKKIVKQADKLSLPPATFVHDISLKGANNIRIPLPITDQEVIKKVILYGNNLNQIAKSMNALNHTHSAELKDDLPYLSNKVDVLAQRIDELNDLLMSRIANQNDRKA